MKNLTIVIPFYTSKENVDEIVNIFKEQNLFNCNILFINDQPIQTFEFDFQNKNYTFINQKENKGKFWSIVESIEKNRIHTEYFLTIDPDDILLGCINFELLQKLIFKINECDKHDFFINSYFLKEDLKIKKKNKFNISVFLTPNIIYNTNNIRLEIEKKKIKYYGEKLSYYEDKLFTILTSNEQKHKYLNYPFYTYNKYIGMTSKKTEYMSEIKQAKELLAIIIKDKNIDDYCKKIKKYSIKKIIY